MHLLRLNPDSWMASVGVYLCTHYRSLQCPLASDELVEFVYDNAVKDDIAPGVTLLIAGRTDRPEIELANLLAEAAIYRLLIRGSITISAAGLEPSREMLREHWIETLCDHYMEEHEADQFRAEEEVLQPRRPPMSAEERARKIEGWIASGQIETYAAHRNRTERDLLKALSLFCQTTMSGSDQRGHFYGILIPRVLRIEQRLHDLVVARLKSVHGDGWWRKVVPIRVQDELRGYPQPWERLGLRQLYLIIEGQFARFQTAEWDRKDLQRLMADLIDLRNIAAHPPRWKGKQPSEARLRCLDQLERVLERLEARR